MTEYLRMNGMYWGLTAMSLAGQLDRMDRDEVVAFVRSCQTEGGGMSCSVGHDPHMLSTLSAVQVVFCWAFSIVTLGCHCDAFCFLSFFN